MIKTPVAMINAFIVDVFCFNEYYFFGVTLCIFLSREQLIIRKKVFSKSYESYPFLTFVTKDFAGLNLGML